MLSVVDEHLLVAPPTPFVGMHAAIALAARRDATGLRLLGRHAALHPRAAPPRPGGALRRRDVRAGRLADPTGRRSSCYELMPDVARFGGSKAQREVVEQTLLYALVEARQTRIAGRLVHHVTDRPAL